MRQTWQYLSVSVTGRSVVVRFDSGNKMNTLNHALMEELLAFAEEVSEDSSVNCVVLTGQNSVFTAGMDLKDPAISNMSSLSLAEKRIRLKLGPRLCAAWESIEPVTIAALEGHCVGGGAALVAACDLRVASRSARIMVPELKLGMNMSWQSVPRFVSLIGPARTKKLLLLAEEIAAEAALNWGLVDYVVEQGKALDFALDQSEKLSQMPPVPTRMIKRAINVSANALNDATSFMDLDQFMLVAEMEDAREAARAFFEKRPAQFSGD